MLLKQYINNIDEPSEEWKLKASTYLDSLVKPVGSLGKLEDIAISLSSIQQSLEPTINKKVTIVMSADNGIVEESIATSPIELTKKVTLCMAEGKAGISALSKASNADVCVVNIGIKDDLRHENIHDRNIRRGSRNFLYEKAMTREECIKAIEVGIEMVKYNVDQGYDIFGTGEMGIGNTTTSSAVITTLLNLDVELSVGKGAGLSDEGLIHKKRIVKTGIDKHNLLDCFKEDPCHKHTYDEVINVLASVGGYDIAGLVGVFLGCAYYEVPVVIDGVISVAAALAANKLNPKVKKYMIASHCSVEPAYLLAIRAIGLEPLLQLDMRLGEGTGCPLTFNLVESACEMMKSMIKFEDINVVDDYMVDLRKG